MATLITLIILILLGSAFFSGLEAALFAIPSSRVDVLRQQRKGGSEFLSRVKEKMSRPIIVIVIFNNVINIVGSILVGYYTTSLLGNTWIGLVSAVLTFLIIIFGEIVPKTIGENHSERTALFFAQPLWYATKIFYPLIWIVEHLTDRFVTAKRIVSEEELRFLSHISHLEGAIEKDEREMIQNVFTLNDRTARDIMTPRTVIDVLQQDATLGDVQKELYRLRHSRLPVYDKDVDDVVGIVHQREMLVALAQDKQSTPVREYMEAPLFVSEKAKADYLLVLFQKKKKHLAIVQDEFGGTSGVVSLEDVIEELVGEIVDETDEHEDTRIEAKRDFRED